VVLRGSLIAAVTKGPLWLRHPASAPFISSRVARAVGEAREFPIESRPGIRAGELDRVHPTSR